MPDFLGETSSPAEAIAEFYEHAPCGYISLDRDGRITQVNSTLLEWVARDRDDVVGRRLQDLITAAARIFYETHCAPILATDKILSQISLDLEASGGLRIPALFHWRRVDNAAGEHTGFRLMIVESAERRAYELELLRRSRRLDLLTRFSRRLLDCTDPDSEALPALFDELRNEAGVEGGAAYLMEGDYLRLTFATGLDQGVIERMRRLEIGEGMSGKVAREGQRFYLPDRRLLTTDLDLRSSYNELLCEPLIAGGKVIGTIGFAGNGSGLFGEEEQELFRLIADTLAIARQRERAVRHQQETAMRLQQAMDAAAAGSWSTDFAKGSTSLSAESAVMLGLSAQAQEFPEEEWLELIDRRDYDLAWSQVVSAREGVPVDFSYRTARSGGRRWLQSLGRAEVDPSGKVIKIGGLLIDVTARKETEERERLLMLEIDHRAKNMLAVVQSVVRLTRAERIEDFVAAVSGRIHALSRAHGLLAAARWEGAELRSIVADELEAYGGNPCRIMVSGPPVRLLPAAAQGISLVIHELATNAAKYGALSVPQGKLDVKWEIHDDADGETAIDIVWGENKGPQVSLPQHRGFGTSIIRATIENQLGGSFMQEWHTAGLCCTIHLPGTQLLDSGTEAALPAAAPITQPTGLAVAHRPERPVILILEDEALIAMELEDTLQNRGFDTLGPASSVAEALELFDAHAIDAAVLDVSLHGEKSFAVADRFHARRIPFVFLTGYSGEAIPPGLQYAKVLAKPVSGDALIEALRGLIMGRG